MATVMTGSAGAQAIGMLFAPVITRLYGPEAFGLQSIFTSLVGVLAVLATMGYQVAIVLPKRDAEAIGLAQLSLLIACGVGAVSGVVFGFLGTDFLELVNAETIGNLVYLIPIAMTIAVLANVLYQWLIRKRAFALNARYTVATMLLINIAKYCIGLVHPSAIALILTNMFGALLGVIFTFHGWRKSQSGKSVEPGIRSPEKVRSNLRKLAREYSDFPLFRTPQALASLIAQSLPLLMLAGFSGTAVAGQYSIVIAVLGMPTNLIANSVRAVFYPRINEAALNGENVRALILRTSAALLGAGVLPFSILIFAGPALFEFAFGSDWRKAGEYGQWMCIFFFLQFISVPAVSAIPVLKLQGRFLIFELVSTGLRMLMLWLGFVFFGSDHAAIALFSVVGASLYCFLIVWAIRRSVDMTLGERSDSSLVS
ncbi:MAG: lipopolysaccharide biosynthesis protein [Erythrobacter sp.]